MTDDLRPLIVTTAMRHRVSPDLAHAIVLKESSGNPWAWNPEPHYRYLWNVAAQAPFRKLTLAERASEVPPKDFPFFAGDRDQEWWAQQASWGLMQVMGGLARELGFKGPYLPQIVDPEINLDLGCKALAAALRWSRGDIRKAVASYNAGRGGYALPVAQAYADAVLRNVEQVRTAHA